MLIHTLVASVGTCPEPSILAVFDGFNEKFTHFVSRGFGVSMLAQNNLPKLFCSVYQPSSYSVVLDVS